MEKYIYNILVDFDTESPAVLCSLIDWKGSVPRRDYPVMLVADINAIHGTIGGGNLEHKVIKAANSVLQSRQSMVQSYDLSGTDTAGSDGICGGNVKVLLEPYTASVQSQLKSAYEPQSDAKRIIVMRITGEDPAQVERYIVATGFSKNNLPAGVNKIINKVQTSGKTRTVTTAGEYFVIQSIMPPPELHIFGAGHVGKAVAELASFIELDVHIYDDRLDLATKDRFPNACSIVVAPIDELSSEAVIPSQDFVLIATRGHRHDFELMKWLLTKQLSYLGLMSSERKWRLLSSALQRNGFTEQQLAAVHSPVGMDIASETVPEIAVSIISELINHYRTGDLPAKSFLRRN